MPTPWDYQRVDASKSMETVTQQEQGPTYPNIYDRSQMTGAEEIDRQEMTSRTGDPIELARQAEESANRFIELQDFLNNSRCDTIGSRPPGSGLMDNTIEAERDHPLPMNRRQNGAE